MDAPLRTLGNDATARSAKRLGATHERDRFTDFPERYGGRTLVGRDFCTADGRVVMQSMTTYQR